MNVEQRNHLLALGDIDRDDLWPKVKEYEGRRFQFRWDFGLETLPTEPGILTIRGPRQSGKSAWLELQLLDTIEDHGKATAYFLNGDYIYSHEEFEAQLLELEQSFAKKAKVKRIFIDEVTQIAQWERVIKRLIDSGHLRDILIVTTGSNAADLRRGSERLPGRKGQLTIKEYTFLPISYKEYLYQVGNEIGMLPGDTLWGYFLTGGSPLAIHEFYFSERLTDTFTSLIADWILGDFAQSGRSRIFFLSLLRQLYRVAPGPLSYTKLAKEAGLANNTAALDYVERLADLLCIQPMMQFDAEKRAPLSRKASKFPFINMAMAWTFHPKSPRYLHELRSFEGQDRGALFEWVVAQELFRRYTRDRQVQSSSSSVSIGEDFFFWSSKEREVDFVCNNRKDWIEVKSGKCSPQEFTWFTKIFPKKQLQVVSESSFETDWTIGKTIEQFLIDAPSNLDYDEEKFPESSHTASQK